MAAPVIILVHPQLGENIGAVARAMANFGFKELRLVAPRDGWPNEKARHMASGAENIIDAAKLFPDFNAAMADIHIAYATTARPRDMEKRTVTPEEAMREIDAKCQMSDVKKESLLASDICSPTSGATRHAFVFGPERTGLENEHIVLCDTLITIPTAPEKTSLNLAQSMVVVGYEWFKKVAGNRPQETESASCNLLPATSATKADWNALFDQIDSYLEETDYYRVDHKKEVMWQNMRNMFLRGNWSEQEIRTFRGMLRILYEGRKPRKNVSAS
jgi:tRNA/rRNA methyltransferase